MQNEMLKNLQAFSSQALESVKKVTDANQKVAAELLNQQAALTNDLIKAATQSSQALAEVKDPKDLNDIVAKQAELAQANAKKLADNCKSCADIVASAGKTYNDVFESNVKAATAAAEKAGAQCANTAKSTKAA